MQISNLLIYLGRTEAWGAKIVWAAIIVLTGYLAPKIAFRVVDHFLPTRALPHRPYGTPKELRTLATLVKSIIQYVTVFLVLGFLFKVFNLNLTPLLVSAGVVGFAVGFGAQSFIKDLISGITFLFEKNFSVGNYVEVGDAVGIIEDIGIRTTKIRDISGRLHILFNGNISTIKSFTAGSVKVILDVFLKKKEDVASGSKILRDLLEDYFHNVRLGVGEIAVSTLQMRSPQTAIRAEFSIIPLYQNFLFEKIVPRLREVFSEQGILLSTDRVDATLVFQYPQGTLPVP